MTVRASKGRYGGANALFTYQDDIVVKNGSTVDAFAEGEVSAAFSTRNDRPNEKGGHIYISDRCQGHSPLCRERRRPHPLQRKPRWRDEARTPRRKHRHHRPDQRGRHTRSHLDHPQQVTAEGDTAAIFARAMSADGKTIGTIKIENAAIQTPEGGKVIDYRKLRDGIYEAGQAIGTGDATVDSSISKQSPKVRPSHLPR
ncbi:MAG: hypothetical protein ACLU37_03855 [Collinsella sp.]